MNCLGPYGGPCPPGHRCPAGSAVAQPCPPGTYQPLAKNASCAPCEAGFFCPRATAQLTAAHKCPLGYYCPPRTEHKHLFPCPPGTYNNATGQSSPSDCKPCDQGFYCDTPAATKVSGQQSAGRAAMKPHCRICSNCLSIKSNYIYTVCVYIIILYIIEKIKYTC